MTDVDFSRCAGKRVCVALSGGADSVALFLIFRENAEQFHIALSAVNVEHGIRGEESLADTAFVKDLCGKAGVPLFCFSADIPALAKKSGRGLEEEAREYRRKAFERLIEEGRADLIATAHHAGDNAESVLFNLFRGASLTGAGGIRAFVPVTGDKGIVRPLLAYTKADILEYLRSRGAAWREDSTNADRAYARNFLRHEVLAPAGAMFPGCEKNLYAFSRNAREDDEYLFSLTDGYVEEGKEFIIRAGAPLPVLKRCCIRALRYFGAEKDYTSAHVAAVCALLGKESGAEADLPQGLKAVNDYGSLAVYRPAPPPSYSYPFAEGEFGCGGYVLRVSRGVRAAEGKTCGRALYLNGAALPAGAVIRPRQNGDVFRKFGGGTKKLKEYFIDKKIPARRRDAYPLIAEGKEVFAVCGLEISDKARLPEESGRLCCDGAFTLILYGKGEESCRN